MNPLSESTAAIECRDVWKIFGVRAGDALTAIRREMLSKQEILSRFGCVVGVGGVSFSVARGETLCIMGLSGSGKSTLVRHVNRLIEPTSGEVLVDGEDIGRKSASDLRRIRARKIGMVFQHVALFPHRSVWRNVAYGLEVQGVAKAARRATALAKLNLMHLGEYSERMPHELSGGQQQRVGLARALATDPDVLLMDEPFSALDPLIRRQLQDQFLDLAKVVRKSTIFITHDLEEAMRLGDRVAIMRESRFVQVGTPDQILLHPADEYVRDFVQGVPRLKILRARSVMEPLPQSQPGRSGAALLETCPRMRAETKLEELVRLVVETELPVVVTDENDRDVGIITRRALLRSMEADASWDTPSASAAAVATTAVLDPAE